MNEEVKEIKLIGPPHWYKDDEEETVVKPPCRCGECGSPAQEKQRPDPKIEVNDKK